MKAWVWDVAESRDRFSWVGWYALSPGVFDDEVRDRLEDALTRSMQGVEGSACVAAIASVPHLSPAAYPLAVFLLEFLLSEPSPGRPALVYLTDCCSGGQMYAGLGEHPAFGRPVPVQFAIRAEVQRALPGLVGRAASWPADMVDELVFLLYASYWDHASGQVACTALEALTSRVTSPLLSGEPDGLRAAVSSGKLPSGTELDEPTRFADDSYAIRVGRSS